MTALSVYADLPRIMVAPNGARRKKADHPATPVTIQETVDAAILCHQAGAGGIHAHLRDKEENHLLDAGLYREMQQELRRQLPGFYIQITTEAVGVYSPEEQRKVVYESEPRAASVSVREMLRDGENTSVQRFYHDMANQDVAIQHILYSDEDVALLADLVTRDIVPANRLAVLFVLGRYSKDLQSIPADLDPFLATLPRLDAASEAKTDWACCAFGSQENACLSYAFQQGGKARIGFENNVLNPDGQPATDNADRIRSLLAV